MHDRIGRAAAAGLLVMTMLTYGARPADEVALVTASERVCGANALCPNDPPPDACDQATAERRVTDGYVAIPPV